MAKILFFIRQERLYILLFTFIVLVNILGHMAEVHMRSHRGGVEAVVEKEGVFLEHGKIEKALQGNRTLALIFGLASLLMAALFFLGLLVDGILVSMKFAKRQFITGTYVHMPIKWGLLDVWRSVVIFLFLGHIFVIVESSVLSVFPIAWNYNFKLVFNSCVIDLLAVAFVLYYSVRKYGEKLLALGISLKNFGRNVFYGIVGYLSILPVLVLILALIAFVIQVTKYVPQKQQVVEIFLKEENQLFLFLTSLFTAVLGPFVEELFFRGFLYNAVKRHTGIVWASLLTSAVFAMLHANLVGFLPIMVLGVLLAYLYERTGTLVAPITVHIIHNVGMLFLVFLVKQVKV